MSDTPVRAERSGRPPQGEAILTRAFRLLASFRTAGEALSLAALAHRARMPKSTTLRIATQLTEVGALERRSNGEFVIGLGLLELASLAPRGHGLRAAALPYLQDLHHVTRQHVLLAVRDGAEAVLIERLSSHDATPVMYRIGGRLPLAATGVGIALLAYAPEPLRTEIIESTGPNTSSSSSRELRQLISAVRTEGVMAVTVPDPMKRSPGIATIAAPVLDGRGGAHGAISLVSPAGKGSLSGQRVALRTISLAIARAIGPAPRPD